MTFAAILALGTFNYAHFSAARFALPGVALHLFAIAVFGDLIAQLSLAARIDYAQPLAPIQRRLERLRLRRIRHVQWVLLGAALAWTPLLIVVLQGLWGVDAYQTLGLRYLVASTLFGLAVIPVAIWLSRRFGDRLGRSPAVERLLKDIAGHHLIAATAFLVDLSEFERGER